MVVETNPEFYRPLVGEHIYINEPTFGLGQRFYQTRVINVGNPADTYGGKNPAIEVSGVFGLDEYAVYTIPINDGIPRIVKCFGRLAEYELVYEYPDRIRHWLHKLGLIGSPKRPMVLACLMEDLSHFRIRVVFWIKNSKHWDYGTNQDVYVERPGIGGDYWRMVWSNGRWLTCL